MAVGAADTGLNAELNRLLPWHGEQWMRLREAAQQQRLPHALLLQGPEGTGKHRFAQLLARALLCRRPDAAGLPCGECDSCVLIRAGNHPDLRHCEPEIDPRSEKVKDSIGIEQVRELGSFMAMKSHHGGFKIAILKPADKLNMNASNALLKTLEEPPQGALLILSSSRPSRLPATVLSRCQRLRFAPVTDASARDWLAERLPAGQDADVLLALSAGAPLAALALGEQGLQRRMAMLDDLEALAAQRADPLVIAEAWLKFGVKESLYWLYVWLADMIRLRTSARPPLVSNPDQRDRLQALAAQAAPERLHRLLGKVETGLRLAEGQSNPQLLLEEILLSLASNKQTS
jgi:DNA polymerase-3 subunit delta'